MQSFTDPTLLIDNHTLLIRKPEIIVHTKVFLKETDKPELMPTAEQKNTVLWNRHCLRTETQTWFGSHINCTETSWNSAKCGIKDGGSSTMNWAFCQCGFLTWNDRFLVLNLTAFSNLTMKVYSWLKRKKEKKKSSSPWYKTIEFLFSVSKFQTSAFFLYSMLPPGNFRAPPISPNIL